MVDNIGYPRQPGGEGGADETAQFLTGQPEADLTNELVVDSNTPLEVTRGGTGANNASQARINLGITTDSGLLRLNTRNVNSNTSVNLNSDAILFVDASGGVITVTLPTAVGQAGKGVYIKKVDGTSNAVNVTPQAGQQIDDLTAGSSWVIDTPSEAYLLTSDGSNWQIV